MELFLCSCDASSYIQILLLTLFLTDLAEISSLKNVSEFELRRKRGRTEDGMRSRCAFFPLRRLLLIIAHQAAIFDLNSTGLNVG
jgi:hypothetical protein